MEGEVPVLSHRIAIVVGTRPEAIKMAPVHIALRRHRRLSSTLIATGQHGALFADALSAFGLAPDEQLGVDLATCVSPGQAAARIRDTLVPRLRALGPALLLSQGDTTTALAAAEAAHVIGIPVGHVEAGLRSHDLQRPWPEEGNRIAIDHLSTLLFAPGPDAMINLARDPMVRGACHLVGNSGIDALRLIRSRTMPSRPGAGGHVLVTLHRREVIGPPLAAICGALRRIVRSHGVPLLLPLHPNPQVRTIVTRHLADLPGVRLVEPLPYPAMLDAMASARLILSDSGGIQEEAPALGVPLLILRDTTERPETASCGAALLAGTDPATILRTCERVLSEPGVLSAMSRPRFPYGRGRTSEKIVTVIENYLAA